MARHNTCRASVIAFLEYKEEIYFKVASDICVFFKSGRQSIKGFKK